MPPSTTASASAPRSVKGFAKPAAKSAAKPAAKPATKPATKPAPAPPAPEPEPVTEAPSATEAPAAVQPAADGNPWDAVLAKFDSYDSAIAGMIDQLRALQKEIKQQKKLVKTTSVATSKRKRAPPAGGNPVPSGFRKPTKISEEMREFLNTTEELVTRNAVTAGVMQYIRDNSLGRGKNFAPDETLRALLTPEDREKEEIPYFGLQRFIKHHFIKE